MVKCAPAAAFFDLDKTIIARSSALAFGRPFYASGLIGRWLALKSVYAQLLFSLSSIDEAQLDRMRDAVAAMCTGWDVSQVRRIVHETLHELIGPLVYAEAVALIDEHRRAGREVVIVSSSGTEVVQPIGDWLGVDHVIATKMEIVEGRYTGSIGFYAFGAAKATAIAELAAERGYDLAACYAYSDSATDVPMLDMVGHPSAINPDRALRRLATERGWPIVDFRNPVPTRRRLPRPPQSITAGILGAATAACAGAAWYAHRCRTAG